MQILGKGGVNSESATLLPFAGSAAVEAMNDGKMDAVWIFGAPDGTAVQSFLKIPKFGIMGFQTAEAFTIIFPELVRLVLPQGVIDIDRNIPPNDVPLIGSTPKCWYEAIFIRKLSNSCCRQWWRHIVGAKFFSAAVNFPTARTLNIPLLLQLSIFTKTALRLCRGICLYGCPSMRKERLLCW